MTVSLYLPFVFGIGLVLAQPVMDMVWISNYDRQAATVDHPTTAVRWAADVAAFFPASIPVVLGVVLLLADKSRTPTSNDFLVVSLIVGALAIVAIYISAGLRKELKPIAVWKYTGLQVSLLALNAAGVVVVYLLPADKTTVLDCVRQGADFICRKAR